MEDYDKAIELDPNDAAAYYNRGHSYSDLGQDQRAMTAGELEERLRALEDRGAEKASP